jgi:hypothetical protein
MNDKIEKRGIHLTTKGKGSEQQGTHADQVGGDKIIVGDISDSQGVAIGRDAQVRIQSGISPKELVEVFAPIYQTIEVRQPDPLVEKEEITDRVRRIENEIATGEKAQPSKVERWLRDLAGMAPDILDVTVAAIMSPVAGISVVIQKIAQKVKEDMH